MVSLENTRFAVIVIFCIILFAMLMTILNKVNKMSVSAFTNPLALVNSNPSLRFQTETSGSTGPQYDASTANYYEYFGNGAWELPTFWNAGSYEDVNTLQQQAYGTGGSPESVKAAVMGRLNSGNYVGAASEQLKQKNADLAAAASLGLVQNAAGKWVPKSVEGFEDSDLLRKAQGY